MEVMFDYLNWERNAMSKSIKCPCCGGIVGSSSYGLFCENKCGLYFGRALGTPLSINDSEKLLNGEEIIIQALNKSTGRAFSLSIKWDGTYDAVGSARYLHYSTRYPSDEEVRAYQESQNAVSTIPLKSSTDKVVDEPYSYRFVNELVEVTDDYKIIGGIFDDLTVEAAIAYCRQHDEIWFSHNHENHIRCVIYEAINKTYDKIAGKLSKDKVLGLMTTFPSTLNDLISEITKISGFHEINISSDKSWDFLEKKILLYLKNICFRSHLGADQQRQRKQEIGEISMNFTEFLKEEAIKERGWFYA